MQLTLNNKFLKIEKCKLGYCLNGGLCYDSAEFGAQCMCALGFTGLLKNFSQ